MVRARPPHCRTRLLYSKGGFKRSKTAFLLDILVNDGSAFCGMSLQAHRLPFPGHSHLSEGLQSFPHCSKPSLYPEEIPNKLLRVPVFSFHQSVGQVLTGQLLIGKKDQVPLWEGLTEQQCGFRRSPTQGCVVPPSHHCDSLSVCTPMETAFCSPGQAALGF